MEVEAMKIVTQTDDSPAMSRPTQSAASRTLGIPELFRQILEDMDIRTLFLAQRVSRHWKCTIEDTHKLQVKLYLSPARDMAEAERLCLKTDSFVLKDSPYTICNPLLFERVDCRGPYDSGLVLSGAVVRTIVPGEGTIRSKQSSFDMLISQPPITDDDVRFRIRVPGCYTIGPRLKDVGRTSRWIKIFGAKTASIEELGSEVGTALYDAKMFNGCIGNVVEKGHRGALMLGHTVLKNAQELEDGRSREEVHRHLEWRCDSNGGHLELVECGEHRGHGGGFLPACCKRTLEQSKLRITAEAGGKAEEL